MTTMIAIILTFYGALAAMAVMIGIKLYEAGNNRVVWTTRMFRSIDHVFEAVYAYVRGILAYVSWRNAELLFWWAVRGLFRLLHISYKYVEQKAANDPRSRKIIDMVRGKGIPMRSPGTSIYLKRIKPEKMM